MAEFLHDRLGKPATTATYSIARSLRFNSADSAYLNRTASAGNRRTFTWSGWVKRSSLSSTQRIFVASDGSASSDSDYFAFFFNSSDQLQVGGNNTTWRVTSAVYRDPSAWYHIVLAVDTTLATAADRIKLYVNGSEVTVFGTNAAPTQNLDTAINNSGNVHYIGRVDSAADYFNGYIAEVHFVDGTALTPSSFGQTDATTGQWVPKQPTGITYGTNGFWLSFYDNTSTTTLGRDDAGGAAGSAAGSNDWTLNNFSVTAGVGNDSLMDTPTNNHCTLLPTVQGGGFGGVNTLSNGNLDAVTSASVISAGIATFGMSSGKWYWEILVNSATGSPQLGISKQQIGTISTNGLGQDATSYVYAASGSKGNNNSFTSHGSSYTSADVISFAYDADNGKLFFGKNGTWQNSSDPVAGTNAAFTGLTGETYFPAFSDAGNATTVSLSFNFGQRAFSYTPPTGFSALCTSNLPTPSIVKPSTQFDVETFTGTGATRSKTGLGFQPDFVWFKGRSGATDHALYDSVRGVQKDLGSNLVATETTQSTGLTAFNSDGYTTGSLAKLNTSAATYAAWLWKKGVTPGFDIVSYAGNSTLRTISHALGVAPAFMIVKRRTGGNINWATWHKNLTSAAYWAQINTTNAQSSDTTLWNSTAPTSSVFTVNTASEVNLSSNDYIAYLWAEVAGFSKFGSYTGNGSADGPFVHCGFRPRWIMVKRTDTTGDWYIWDTARDTYNAVGQDVLANSSAAESGTADLDTVSNGFKLRATTAGFNASAGTYVFAAFAEFPFKYANAR